MPQAIEFMIFVPVVPTRELRRWREIHPPLKLVTTEKELYDEPVA